MRPTPLRRRIPLALGLTGAVTLSGLGALFGAPGGAPFALGIAGCSPMAAPHPASGPASAAPRAPAAASGAASGADLDPRAAIDASLRAAWHGAGITPAGRVDDAGFLRRVYLDLAGALPAPDAVTAFLADTAPDKRAKAVDALLASPRYAERWTDAWEDILFGEEVKSPTLDRAAFRRWLRRQLEANTPWDKLVSSLITATGRNSVGGPRTAAGSPASDVATDEAQGVNGAVNWLLKYQRAPQDLPANASRLFLGVQIQCAQCHDHKSEKWTQGDFRSFAACFAQTRARPLGDRGDKGVRAVEVVDEERPRGGKRKAPNADEIRAIAASTPKTLDGVDLSDSDNRRQALAAWMVAPDNPWFARAIVNRIWARLVGSGFVEPIDDLRPGNAPVLPELFEALARDFASHGYDLKRLLRTIADSEVYQLAAAPARFAAGQPADDALWPRFRVRPLSPDVLLDAMIDATGLAPVIDRMAGEKREAMLAQIRRGFGFLFDVDEEGPADAAYEGTIPQALLLLNGALSAAGTSAAIPGTALEGALAAPGQDAATIEALYLRALSRRPTAAETERWTRYVNEPRSVARTDAAEVAADKRDKRGKRNDRTGAVDVPQGMKRRLQASPGTAREQAYEDLLWALLNSSEFFFNH